MLVQIRNGCSVMFYEKAVPKSFANFPNKQLPLTKYPPKQLIYAIILSPNKAF